MKDENRGIYLTNYRKGVFRKKNNVTLGRKIMLREDKAEGEFGDCAHH